MSKRLYKMQQKYLHMVELVGKKERNLPVPEMRPNLKIRMERIKVDVNVV